MNMVEHRSGGFDGNTSWLFVAFQRAPLLELCSGWGFSRTTSLRSLPASELVQVVHSLLSLASSMATNNLLISEIANGYLIYEVELTTSLDSLVCW